MQRLRQESVNSAHGEGLELIVVWLIVLEIVLGVVRPGSALPAPVLALTAALNTFARRSRFVPVKSEFEPLELVLTFILRSSFLQIMVDLFA